MYSTNGNGNRHQSTSYRGNGQSRFEQDQQYRPARQTTESTRFQQMGSRMESRRYQRDQGYERSGFDCQSRQETEYNYRGDHVTRYQSEYQKTRFNNQYRHEQQYDYNNRSTLQQGHGFRSKTFVEQRNDRIEGMRPASLPVSSDSDSDSQSDDGSSTKNLGKAFSFEQMLKSVEEFRKLDWSEEVEKEYAEQQLEKKRAEFFSKAGFIMKSRTGNPVWDIKKRKPIVYREKTYYNYIHYG